MGTLAGTQAKGWGRATCRVQIERTIQGGAEQSKFRSRARSCTAWAIPAQDCQARSLKKALDGCQELPRLCGWLPVPTLALEEGAVRLRATILQRRQALGQAGEAAVGHNSAHLCSGERC